MSSGVVGGRLDRANIPGERVLSSTWFTSILPEDVNERGTASRFSRCADG